MIEDEVIRLGKFFHAACLGKVIEVPWLYCYGGDDNSHDLEGPFKVRVDSPGMEHDLEEMQAGHYDPNWSVTPLPGQDIPEGSRTFWCTPVSYAFDTGKWDVTFRVVPEPIAEVTKPNRYRVDMSGLAFMRGNIEVEADSEEEAAKKAVDSSGNVLWDYNGMEDDTIEVNSVEARQ